LKCSKTPTILFVDISVIADYTMIPERLKCGKMSKLSIDRFVLVINYCLKVPVVAFFLLVYILAQLDESM